MFVSFLFIAYGCQGSWTDNTTTYIVATHSGSQHPVCITYHLIDTTSAHLYVSDSCYRPTLLPTTDHHLAANLTIIGKLISFEFESFQTKFIKFDFRLSFLLGKCMDVSSAVNMSVDSLVLTVTLLFTIIILNRNR